MAKEEKMGNSIVVDVVSDKIKSAYIKKSFDLGNEVLEEQGYKVISLEKEAELRIQEGPNSNISRLGNFTREGIIIVPKKGWFLTKKSPIMKNLGEATDWHLQKLEYLLNNDQIEEALSDSVEIPTCEILTNKFADYEITNYAFGDASTQYGDFLRKNGIFKFDIAMHDPPVVFSYPLFNDNGKKVRDVIEDYTPEKPFARQVWFTHIGWGSEQIVGCRTVLDWFFGIVRGIRE